MSLKQLLCKQINRCKTKIQQYKTARAEFSAKLAEYKRSGKRLEKAEIALQQATEEISVSYNTLERGISRYPYEQGCIVHVYGFRYRPTNLEAGSVNMSADSVEYCHNFKGCTKTDCEYHEKLLRYRTAVQQVENAKVMLDNAKMNLMSR